MITQEKIERVTKEMFEGSQDSPEPTEQASAQQPIDFYQSQRNAAYEASQKATTNGSPAQMTKVVNEMVEDLKQNAYNVTNSQYNHLMEVDAKDSAESLRQSYMTGNALPLVESLVEEYGVDALLNNKKALSKLDEIIITNNGSGEGFTRGYLNKMHEQHRGRQASSSDAEVRRGIERMSMLADSSDVRASVALAGQIKERVDNGELSADETDYETLVRVSSYGQ